MTLIPIRLGRRILKARHLLVAVGALCSIAILGGTLLLLERDRQGDLRAEDERGMLLASVLESHVSRTLSSVDNSLNAISRVLLLPAGRSAVGPGGVDVQALLDTLASSSTYLRSVSVLDAGGRVISSSNAQNIGRSFSLAQLGFRNEINNNLENGRPLFVRDLHELDDRTDAGTASSHAERGVYVLPFATLIKVGGANLTLLALVNPAYLFPDHRAGPRDDVGYEVLFDYQGMVLAATPDAPFTIGSRHARLPMFDLLNNDNEYGRFDLLRKGVDASDAANGNYLVNFRASRSFPLVAVVALSEERVLATWQDGARSLETIGIAAALLALLYAAALHRTMGAGERTREELRKARDAAETANAAKSVFLSTMSHEIRTPMNGVLGMAALLRDTPLNAQQQEFARTISDSGEALLSIINDILDFSKIEAGHMDIDVVDCALLPLAEGCIDTLASRAASRGLVLASLIDPALPAMVRADGGRLRQILLNLVDNAIKFTPSGEVTLRVMLAGQANGLCRVDFEVIDSGIGIADETLSRLFQPFVQADSSVTRTYGGTGLGLSICKRLLELMGSRIEVDSRPGLGSTFRFRLELGVAAPPALALPLPSAEVLVLTPLSCHAAVLSAYLRSWGMQVRQASSLEQALAPGDAASLALAIIDGTLPALEQTARMLAASHPGLRLMLLADSDSAQEKAVHMGFHATLRRPFRQAALQEALLFALDHRHYMLGTADAAPAAAAAGAGLAPEAQAPRLVLLVEDNPINQKVALHQLGRLGYAAHVASNGEEALKALALHDYALVLMDCQMPLLDGFEATRRIRDAEHVNGSPRLFIVAMTANAAEGDRERCLAAGMDDYLAKPIVRETLAALLRQYVPLPAQAGAAGGASLRTGTGAASGGGALRCE
jgi:two-component system sensor histidine kinase/response regulator